MKVARRSVIIFVALAVGAGIGWFLGRVQPGAQIEQLRADLKAAMGGVEDLNRELTVSGNELFDAEAEAKAWKRKARERQPIVGRLRLRSREVLDLLRVLGPGGLNVSGASLVPQPGADLLITEWDDDGGDGSLPSSGFDVWLVQEGNDGVPNGLRRIFMAHPDLDTEMMTIGDPADLRREPSLSSYVRADAADVTADGLRDLVVQDAGSGSGGCGVARVLRFDGAGFSEIFRKEGCDHYVTARGGKLIYEHAISPKGCKAAAHGCGTKHITMGWTGTDWEVVDVARSVYEQ